MTDVSEFEKFYESAVSSKHLPALTGEGILCFKSNMLVIFSQNISKNCLYSFANFLPK